MNIPTAIGHILDGHVVQYIVQYIDVVQYINVDEHLTHQHRHIVKADCKASTAKIRSNVAPVVLTKSQ